MSRVPLPEAARAAARPLDVPSAATTSAFRSLALSVWQPGPARTVDAGRVVMGASLWMATAGNVALWQKLSALGALSGSSGGLLGTGMALVVVGGLALLLSAFAWPRTLKPMLVVLFAVTAFSAHFSLSYGVVMDPTMLTNVLQTDPHEAADLMSTALVWHLLLLGALPIAVLLCLKIDHGSAAKAVRRNLLTAVAGLLLVVGALVACFQPLASTMRNHKQVRYLINPLNVVYSLGTALFSGPARSKDVLPIGQDATIVRRFEGLRPPLLVLVVGETGRSGNFSVNGYGRDTNPALAAEDVVSFTNAWSCGTSTAASVPCMFSRMTRKTFFDRDHEEEGVLDVLRRAGYAVLWVDNQAGCKGVCDRVPNATVDPAANPKLCNSGECLDEALLAGLDTRLHALPAEQLQRGAVVVLHQMGSHGPAYFRRSPAETKRFLPECTSAQLQDCSREELVNAYDNSVAYTDRMLGGTLQWLKGKEARWRPAMLYVADHGESLGEGNLYLHGLPYAVAPDVQKHVPWVTWMSSEFRQGTGIDWRCLQQRRDAEVLHDHLFHSLLGLMNVRTSVYESGLDAYATCRAR